MTGRNPVTTIRPVGNIKPEAVHLYLDRLLSERALWICP